MTDDDPFALSTPVEDDPFALSAPPPTIAAPAWCCETCASSRGVAWTGAVYYGEGYCRPGDHWAVGLRWVVPPARW